MKKHDWLSTSEVRNNKIYECRAGTEPGIKLRGTKLKIWFSEE